VRKVGLMVAALSLGIVAPLPAQFSLNSLSGGSAKTLNIPVPSSVSLNQMIPKLSTSSALIATQGNNRMFNFSKLLPNFSYISNRWPLQTGRSQIPAKYFGPYNNLKTLPR
jgi:hypothetical protein